jgi:hypothetical protein
MKKDYVPCLLALGDKLPSLPERYCKKCGLKLVSENSDLYISGTGEYSEYTGEEVLYISKTQRCPRKHLKKIYVLYIRILMRGICTYSFSELANSNEVYWELKYE